MMRKGTVLIFLGLLLMAAAFFLTGYNLVEDYLAAELAKSAAMQLEGMLPTEETVSTEPESLEQEETVPPDYVLNPGMPMPEKTVDGCNYIGLLQIPNLDLELPVLTSWSYDLLQIAPCRFDGSAYTHDLILSAHNYRHHFGKLDQLIPGDQLIFTDMDGNVFVYEVSYRETLGGNDGIAMRLGDWDMTLFTCTIGGEYRVTIRCKLVEEIPNT